MDETSVKMDRFAPGDQRSTANSLLTNSREFLAFIFLGAGILTLHMVLTGSGFETGTTNPLLRALPAWLLPCLIVIFFGLGLNAGKHRSAESRQRFADNLYFLGFIFTMGSLIATFLPATWRPLEIGSNQIYSAFGTALMSTALGLILRVVVMQTAPSADESAAEIEEDLTRLTAQVAAEARAIGAALADARGKIAESNEANVKSVLGAIAPRLEALVGEFGKATQDATALLRTQAEATRGDAEALRLKVKTQTSDITEAARVLAEARQNFSGALNGLAGPVELLGKEVSDAGATTADTANKLRNEIARLTATLTAAVGNSEKLLGAIDSVSARTTAKGDAIDTAIDGLSGTIATGADSVAAALGNVERIATRVTTDATDFQSQIDAALVAFTGAVERFTGQLDSLRAEVSSPPLPPRGAEPSPFAFRPPTA